MEIPPVELLTQLNDYTSIYAALILKRFQIPDLNLIKIGNRLKWAVLQHVFEQKRCVEANVSDFTYQVGVLFSEGFEFDDCRFCRWCSFGGSLLCCWFTCGLMLLRFQYLLTCSVCR